MACMSPVQGFIYLSLKWSCCLHQGFAVFTVPESILKPESYNA
jgi:hypothetical protein